MEKIYTKQMKQRMPVPFNIKLENEEFLPMAVNNPDIRKFVIDQTIDAIKDGHQNKKSSTTLFSVYCTQFVVELDKYQWKPSLESALAHYELEENWDRCIEIRDLINSL